jgi:hypothetical protein
MARFPDLAARAMPTNAACRIVPSAVAQARRTRTPRSVDRQGIGHDGAARRSKRRALAAGGQTRRIEPECRCGPLESGALH